MFGGQQGGQQNYNEVTCFKVGFLNLKKKNFSFLFIYFKCGDKGHYANKCDKGALAFLRNPQTQDQQ